MQLGPFIQQLRNKVGRSAVYITLNAMNIGSLDPSLALRPDLQSGLGNRARALINRPLESLTPADLAFCLRQSIAVPHIAPLAIDLVARQPLIETELFPGDLLLAVVHAARNKLLAPNQLRELRDACSGAIAAAETVAESLVPKAKAFIAAYDGA